MADDDSDKYCNAQRPNQADGVLCQRPAGWGTDHLGIGRCKRHGGSTPNHEVAAQRVMAIQACDRLGLEIDVSAEEALLTEVRECAGNVAFYRRLVQELDEHPAADIYDEENEHWQRGEPGIYGRTYHVSGVPTGEGKPHVLVVLYNQERDRLRAVATEVLKAGVEARRLQLAEADAAMLLAAHATALINMGLEARLEEFRLEFVAAIRTTEERASLGALAPG